MAGGESVWWRTQVFCHDEGDILIWWVIELSCFTESGGQSQRPQTYQWARHKKARWQGAIKQGSNQTSERYQSVLCPCVCVCVCVSIGERTCVCHIKQEMFVAAVGLVWTAITISGNSSQACGCDSAGGSLSAIASLPRSPPCTFCSSTLRPPPSSLTSSSLSPPPPPVLPVCCLLSSCCSSTSLRSVKTGWHCISSTSAEAESGLILHPPSKVITASHLFQSNFKKPLCKAVKTRCPCSSGVAVCSSSSTLPRKSISFLCADAVWLSVMRETHCEND